jgi:hypothetical protein
MGGVAGDGAKADDRGCLRGAERGGAERQRTGNGADGKIAMHVRSPDLKAWKA